METVEEPNSLEQDVLDSKDSAKHGAGCRSEFGTRLEGLESVAVLGTPDQRRLSRGCCKILRIVRFGVVK